MRLRVIAQTETTVTLEWSPAFERAFLRQLTHRLVLAAAQRRARRLS